MKQTKNLTAIIITTVIFGACQKDIRSPQLSNTSPDATSVRNSNSFKNEETSVGHVYTLSNQVSGNEVIDYRRAVNGSLTLIASYSTGGNGTGGGLGNQGAVILGNEETLLAVNAGSNSISSFEVTSNGLSLKSTINSGGITPVSITQHKNIVFVLNAGGDGNISGFTLDGDGMLHSIPGSTRPLSTSDVGPAQIEFVNDGAVLAITEKGTNKITTYTVNGLGIPGTMHTLTSATPTPFGFAVSNSGIIYVSEAAGGAPGASVVSSYDISSSGMINLVDASVSAGQSAACWVVLTNNGKYVFATNTGSNTISSFTANQSGNLSVLNAVATMTDSGPIDAALSNNSKFLYVLNAGDETIGVFAVGNDGSLSHVQDIAGLPDGATGMAAK